MYPTAAHPYSAPFFYRENIERLMDDKTFKNEIVLFNIDTESTVLHADHRAEVLPVVIT